MRQKRYFDDRSLNIILNLSNKCNLEIKFEKNQIMVLLDYLFNYFKVIEEPNLIS